MSVSIVNRSPYLRASREYPLEIGPLVQEVNKAYLDVANAVNQRSIGIYPVNLPAITGNSYFLKGKTKQQSLRQIYTFTGAGSIPHGINILNIFGISPNTYGSYRDAASNWYGAIYAGSVPVPDQVSFYITPNTSTSVLDGNIVISINGAAPAIDSGIIVIEWIANSGNI